MDSRYSILYIARCVLEARTPLSVSTGSPDGVFDSALVRDANGLPAIPGTSLAGVLRHLWEVTHGDATSVFGYQQGTEGLASRLTVSWGALVDSTGRPADGLLVGPDAKRLREDPVLIRALDQIDAPVYRNRVRITHKGAAAPTGKFDRAVLPAGNRFAIELRLRAHRGDCDAEWERVLGLLRHPGLRLGGATRAGLGSVTCVSLHARRFDLTKADEVTALSAIGRSLGDTSGLDGNDKRDTATTKDWLTGTLTLKARGLWRIGQGNEPLDTRMEKPADLIPVTEERIEWSHGRGKRGLRALLLPASSIKGALAHRMAFHAHRLAGSWADDVTPVADEEPALPDAVTALLGTIKERRDSGEAEPVGQAGCLYIDDAYLSLDAAKVARLMHNAIDRFTGGVRDRVLYEEESLLGGELSIPITLDRKRLDERTPGADAPRAVLRQALDDLCRGNLALGSRTSAGNGFFSGTLTGELADWLNRRGDQSEAA